MEFERWCGRVHTEIGVLALAGWSFEGGKADGKMEGKERLRTRFFLLFYYELFGAKLRCYCASLLLWWNFSPLSRFLAIVLGYFFEMMDDNTKEKQRFLSYYSWLGSCAGKSSMGWAHVQDFPLVFVL